MAEPTVTRATLRREICKLMAMRFFKYSKTEYETVDSGSGSLVVDASFLKQPDNFWNGSFFYVADSAGAALGDNRLIKLSELATTRLTLEFDLAAALSAADKYEIQDTWSASEIHSAINDAINKAWPEFFDTAENETLCIVEDRLEYAIASLTPTPWVILDISVEQPSTMLRAQASAGSGTSITLPGVDLTQVTSAWFVSIYGGTGAGQIQQVATVVGQVVNVTAFSPSPDATSKAMLWNPLIQRRPYYPIIAADVDSNYWPGKIRFLSPYDNVFPGNRLRIRYLAKPSPLTTDVMTTFVPQEYIVSAARAILYGNKQEDNRFDRALFRQRFTDLLLEAQDFKAGHAFAVPAMTFWQERDEAIEGRGFNDQYGNPLDWH